MVDLIGLYKSYLFSLLYWAIQLYIWTVFVYILAGWFVSNRGAGWYVFLEELVEPALLKIRQLTGNRLIIERIDLTPMVLFLLLYVLQRLLVPIFY